MSLARILRTKEEIFRRPQRVRDVAEGRKPIPVSNFYDIVPAAEERKADEYLLIDNVSLIPPEYLDAKNFSKRGPVVVLDTFNGNASRLKSERKSELRARIEAEEKYDRKKGPFIGWGWVDPEQVRHIVRPTIVVEGHRIHQYAREEKDISEKIKVYHADHAPSNTITVKVPSRSDTRPQIVTLEHIPRLRGDDKFVEWTRVSSRHDCDFKRNDFTFRNGGRTITYCPHDVAAYVAYSRKVAEATAEIIPQVFPMFTEPLLRLFMTATRHALIVDHYKEGRKDRTRTRPLSLPEVDPILMDAWLLHGNKQTFFVRDPTKTYETGRPVGERKRMRDYNWWDQKAPGLKFGEE